MQGTGVRGDLAVEAEGLPGAQDGRAVRAERPGEHDDVPGAGGAGRDTCAGQAAADPGRGHEDPVRGTATDDLGVSGDDGHANSGRGRADRGCHPP